LLQTAVEAGWLVEEGGGYRLKTHQPRLTSQQQAAMHRLLAVFRERPYTPPTFTEAVNMAGQEVVETLLEQGELIRVSDDILFLRETYETMRSRIVALLQERGSVTVSEVRDLFGSSRKYVVPLLEYLDAQHLTRRVGDRRVLRRPSGIEDHVNSES